VASSLENLSGPGKPLREESPDEKEFSGPKRSALARLADSGKKSNSLEIRFDLVLAVLLAKQTRLSQHAVSDVMGVSRDTIGKYVMEQKSVPANPSRSKSADHVISGPLAGAYERRFETPGST